MPVRVLILDGNENQAVASTRSLGRAGYEVLVGAPTRWSKAGWSRHSSRSFRYTAPQVDAGRFVQDVVRVAAETPGTIVLPMTERTTLPLSERREALDRVGARYVFPDHASLLRVLNKDDTTALAASLGIATPTTDTLIDDADAARFAESATFPVVLKPRASEETSDRGTTRATGKPLYARTPGEFMTAFRQIRGKASAVVVQEFVEGTGAGYFALANHGELRAEFAHRRIRDVRPTGSGSALRESVAIDEAQRRAAVALLRALRWHGVAMVEFRVAKDGTPVFLEVNGRFWNSLALAVHAGVDFPALLVQMAIDGDITPATTYRIGLRCRWLLGDARHLVSVLRGRPKGFDGRFPRRLETMRHFLTPVRGTYHDNFRWDDPLPEVGDWLDFLGRRLPSALRQVSPNRR